MIPKQCKRLIEVDFPIAAVSKQSAREKSIRHGHPSTLHLWWARRPLSACRSVLLGLLLPDPCDEHCPKDFKEEAKRLLPQLVGEVGKKDEDLRAKLLKFIANFSNWDLSAHPTYLEVARGLVKAAHLPADRRVAYEPPLVVDPFAGGGSIPLEALRVGCDAFASDLNPVACLINKVLLEDIPRHGKTLADELRRVGVVIKAEAEKELAELYPPDPDGSKPVAYLWARTVTCEAPNCGAEIPLFRSPWLSQKKNRQFALRLKVVKEKGKVPKIDFEIFKPSSGNSISGGTINRGNAKCPACGIILPVQRIRTQISEKHGSANNAKLLAVIMTNENGEGKRYRLPQMIDIRAFEKARSVKDRLNTQVNVNRFSFFPNELLPPTNTNSFRLPNYGIKKWEEVFNDRQLISLETLYTKVNSLPESTDLEQAVKRLMTLVVGRSADQLSSFTRWLTTIEALANTFSRQALSMVWDYAECNPTNESGAGFSSAIDWISRVVETCSVAIPFAGQVQQADACESNISNESASIWFTDPPYYNAIGYAELSDFFYVWFKRAYPGNTFIGDPFDKTNQLTPKTRECVQDERYFSKEGRPKNSNFFENTVASAFSEGRRILTEDGIGCVVFAHKTTEGWEALLGGMCKSGWVITASWPIATERTVRLRAKDSAALAASVHLVCRPRPHNSGIGDWANILRELPNRIGDWMERLDKEGVHGADLVFSCIGPALELFSRYEHVETADGKKVELAQYLEKVWEVVGRTALEQVLGTAEARARNGAAGVLEEDARLTALFLWTLMSSATAANGDIADDTDDSGNGDDDDDGGNVGKKKSGYSLQFDVARRFAQPLGIDLDKWKGRIIEIEKGIVRLLPVKERAVQLFGEKSSAEIVSKLERSAEDAQLLLFPSEDVETKAPKLNTSKKISRKIMENRGDKPLEATTLDRVHAAMLLQATGKSAALKALIEAEQKRSPDFVRLSNALSALYPKNSEEKRLLDAMLLAVPRR